jgi:hypothetical protein
MADIEGTTKKQDRSHIYLYPVVKPAIVSVITGSDGEPIEGTEE